MGKQHNKIPNLILAVITPHMYSPICGSTVIMISIIQTSFVHPTNSAKNTALRKIWHDFSVFPEASSVLPKKLFFSI